MKRVLITGANSYIGRSFMNYVDGDSDFFVEEHDLQRNDWDQKDFSSYDTIFHVAGIAHFSKDPSKKDLYYQVNTELTTAVAQKAKAEGIAQFVFMSSIIVYGDSTAKERVITRETEPIPSDFYGDSKLQAEKALNQLADEAFKVTILRPPMIYGKNSKGNYPRLSKLARLTPVFPNIENQRSMLHIDNLCEFLKQVMLRQETGVFFPQNKDYICTSNLVQEIAKVHGKKIYQTRVFNPLIHLLFGFDSMKKLFGNMVYSKELSQYDFDYQVKTFEESVISTESR